MDYDQEDIAEAESDHFNSLSEEDKHDYLVYKFGCMGCGNCSDCLL